MAVITRNGLLYKDDQLNRNNTSVANQALASLKQSNAAQQQQQQPQPAAALPQSTANTQSKVTLPKDTSTNPTAGINTEYGYNPSQSVLDAYDYLQSIIGNRPGEYQSRYGDQLQSMLDQIMNREPFQYDANADPLFQIYQDQYTLGGRRAMQDTMGQAAALTGGYGNSYAESVGQQTYNQYMENLMGIIPELSQMAYGRYQDEGEALARNYDLLNQLENQEYGRYRDLVGDWQTERQLAESTYNTERGFDYGAFSDRRTYDQQQEQFARQMALQEAQLQLQRDQFEWQRAQATRRSSGGSRGRKRDTNTQTAAEIQRNASGFIADLQTPTEFAGHNRNGGSYGGNYQQYVESRVESALNSGRLSDNEALAVLDYYGF